MRSPRQVLDDTPLKYRIALVVALVLGIAGVVFSQVTAEQRRCDHYYADVNHDLNDDPFWETLQQCARENRLPAGHNDPGFYADS